jgi:catechol 2,3-dioxygenase-like lactoylglutathione lyase family enzyme
MARVLGIGGVFYKSPSPKATNDWYKRVLGFEVTDWGGAMFPPLPQGGVTVWTLFPADTTHFAPSTSNLMINFVVDDLDGVLAQAAEQGVEPIKITNDDAYGRFAWLLDPDGMKIELWQSNE